MRVARNAKVGANNHNRLVADSVERACRDAVDGRIRVARPTIGTRALVPNADLPLEILAHAWLRFAHNLALAIDHTVRGSILSAVGSVRDLEPADGLAVFWAKVFAGNGNIGSAHGRGSAHSGCIT